MLPRRTDARAIARYLNVQRRLVSCSTAQQSGHNRWSKIRHDKGKNDQLKSKDRSTLSYKVWLESKYGGPDPSLNPKLGVAIANARRSGLSKSAIDAAIAKGQGKSLSGAPLENVTIECMLPHGVAAIIEFQTENKTRVMQDVRLILSKNNGTVTPTAFLFEKKGRIWFQEQDRVGEDEVLEGAIEAGATEVRTEDGKLVVDTSPSDLTTVADQLQETFKIQVERAEIIFDPSKDSLVDLSEGESQELQRVLGRIEEDPSFQSIYINVTSE